MFSDYTSAEMIFFFILYGVTGSMPFFAALYLLLRRGNAFAPDVTPPVRLRRWAASFFAATALGHVWWYLFYIYSCDLQSASYVVVSVLDFVTLLTTIAGTLLAMLQDRKRPVWPAVAAMIPCVLLGVLQIHYPDGPFLDIATIYILSLYALFSVYLVSAVRQYGRWLNDNYADLENKKVWLSQVVTLVCMLLIILYAFVNSYTILYILHFIELVLFGLLLWRVETLPNLETNPEETHPQPLPVRERRVGELSSGMESGYPQGGRVADELSTPLPVREGLGESLLAYIERQLTEHCVKKQLYLQHDLSLQQLAQEVGINRSYLSQYFSHQGLTYNTYINDLRINHFISHYQEVIAAGQPIKIQQLASDSGYRSYSTFSLAFKQRTGQSVTAWMHDAGGYI